MTSPLRATSPVPLVNVPLPAISIFLPEATVTSPLRATSPAKVADKSDAKVKIVSSIGFKLLPLIPAVADLKIIEPPSPVPLPAPPCSTKSPPALLSVVPAVVEPPLIVRVLPALLDDDATNPIFPATAAAPRVILPLPKIIFSEPVSVTNFI